MLLVDLLRSRTRIDLRHAVGLLSLASIATTMVLIIVNLAAEQAEDGVASMRYLGMMALSLIGYIWAQKKSSDMIAAEVEHILHQLRLSLFDRVRKAAPDTLAKVGQGAVQTALTQEMQTVSAALPLMLNGVQQVVLIICVAAYLAWLSTFAFVMISVLAVVVSTIHLQRMRKINAATRDAIDDENLLFGGLTDLLHGFKEVKMNSRRRDALLGALNDRSIRARDTKSVVKAQWSREFALIQLAFYGMMAAMVFIVPIFTSDYHDVAVQTTTAALFMIGPIGAVVASVPSFTDSDVALRKINDIDHQLEDALDAQHANEAANGTSSPETLDKLRGALGNIAEISLRDVRFAYPGTTDSPGFAVGPINATFKKGEITFITGGNGAGKSTIIAVLTGLRPAAGGSIMVNDCPLPSDALQLYRDHFATVLSDYHLFRELYGIDEIDPKRVETLLKQMEIDDKVEIDDNAFSTTSLSQGQRKRLALIAALLEEKPVLVLDEWAADQDPHFRLVFYEKILPSLRKQGKIIICVTHDDRWFDAADTIYHVRDGEFVDGRKTITA
ncbi:putative ATP-binding cassette transporter [Thalassospira xiamenensis M-5 = DSM 17429]|uniref:Cyclic peptide transporter n=1 Tax=Thalassospira xiamenensis M-5 = DSM 17429 TaxID=1123366 RepID=A0AB72UFT1_9PROT|nr:cyclic peptide export ABC transporter [Thalassospira xiamenensis]AJD52889.1 cyclic peptide transporter [Thalassospira xiamenensis M-5 = DSM 17429]SIT18992.1 putative ATP-binding cassette transporter [Thalassospira xiamenensis M-5 = DSM 17429]